MLDRDAYFALHPYNTAAQYRADAFASAKDVLDEYSPEEHPEIREAVMMSFLPSPYEQELIGKGFLYGGDDIGWYQPEGYLDPTTTDDFPDILDIHDDPYKSPDTLEESDEVYSEYDHPAKYPLYEDAGKSGGPPHENYKLSDMDTLTEGLPVIVIDDYGIEHSVEDDEFSTFTEAGYGDGWL